MRYTIRAFGTPSGIPTNPNANDLYRETLEEALREARAILLNTRASFGIINPVGVWDDQNKVWTMILTDDANGLTEHYLSVPVLKSKRPNFA